MDAVLVQLYSMASSPNTLPGPMLESFCPSLLTSTLPSEMDEICKYHKYYTVVHKPRWKNPTYQASIALPQLDRLVGNSKELHQK